MYGLCNVWAEQFEIVCDGEKDSLWLSQGYRNVKNKLLREGYANWNSTYIHQAILPISVEQLSIDSCAMVTLFLGPYVPAPITFNSKRVFITNAVIFLRWLSLESLQLVSLPIRQVRQDPWPRQTIYVSHSVVILFKGILSALPTE